MSREQIMQMISAAVAAVDPYSCTERALVRERETLHVGDEVIELSTGRLFVVAIGKAAVPMAQAVADVIGDQLTAGVAVTKKGQTAVVNHDAVQTLFAAHPVSNESSVQAAESVLALLEQTAADDQVIFLISGGASALCTKPLIPLTDWQALSHALLASGCSIQEFNTVRKQLDQVKGGGLGQLAAPAKIVTLILSDVLGNPIDMIGSGPTVPNPQAPADALAVLTQYHIGQPKVTQALNGLSTEAASFDSPVKIVGDLQVAAEAAQQAGQVLGLDTKIIRLDVTGEAQEAGRQAAALAQQLPPNSCWILGGETTVTLKGNGIGGRNQEIALAAALHLSADSDCLIATYATDGDDGPTPAAGALVTGQTVTLAQSQGLDAAAYLTHNDSYTFFDQLENHLIITGQTGTNVNDLIFVLRP